ncbi:transcriptional regulator, TetR family [Streptomyces zhaozhouensis]|uniref:Transcriptional regulator, TetR family n=1 Tax=Streptomyces zhaozhouensis TaxID=1300267 RepID=A0A286DU89_9ACTN|nr:TetR/AcrR family transcriptional regulator [Streptomyces zhaozhouensis]SOD62237.1 transcriptional regulator, TetR family [Streptomyces zhaozhouensis]
MTTTRRRGGAMSEVRRRRLRLEISREASRLFWRQGVEATSGDQIAEAVGLSTRTIWRHFRTKESCAEPIVARGVERGVTLLRAWPPHLSLEEHAAAERTGHVREAGADALADDDRLAMRLVVLGEREPALRTAWLMACDRIERELRPVIAERLGLAADDRRVRPHAAAAAAALRVHNEHVAVALLAGGDPLRRLDTPAHLARAVRTATGGAVGDAIARRPGHPPP